MKLIIDIPETAYDAYKEWHKNKVATVEQSLIANGIPYDERPQGEWISRETDGTLYPFWERYECSVCKAYGSCNDNFCPNCGADMRKGGVV